MREIKAVVFDVDGTLVNSEELYYEIVREAYKPYIDLSREEFVKRWMIEQTSSPGMIRDYSLPVSLGEIRARKSELSAIMFDQSLEIMPHAMELLDRLDSAEYPLAAVTSSAKEQLEKKLGKFDLTDRLDVVITSDDVEHKKPHPEPYQKAVEALGVPPNQVAVIEDNPSGAKSAKLAGCKVIAYPNGFTKEMDFPYADASVSSLEEVTGELLSYLSSHFYVRATDRINAITSFDETIARINQLNSLLLEALQRRSEYPVARELFDLSLRTDKNPQKALESLGIDTIGWSPLYSKIVGEICDEGGFKPGIYEAEAWLEELIFERINIGRNVIRYKAARGMAITRKQREEEIIANVRDYAASHDMDPDAVEWIFGFIIQKNKDIQNICKPQGSTEEEKLKVVRSCRTWVEDMVDNIRRTFEFDKKMLEEKYPDSTYHIVVEEETPKSKDNGFKHSIAYLVKLVQE